MAAARPSYNRFSSGWASQWYPSPFVAKITLGNNGEKETEFPSAEHWMMFQKALLFGDTEIAKQILAVKGVASGNMAYIKQLGRQVRNFDEVKWTAERDNIILGGNMLKFQQNEELRTKIMGTGSKQLVEASPRDRIWGIGYGAKNAMSMRRNWGLNLLGKALMETRRILLEEVEVDNTNGRTN